MRVFSCVGGKIVALETWVAYRPLEIDLTYFLGLWCTNREKRPYHHNKHETAQKKNYASFVMAIHGPLSPQMVVSSGFDR